MLPGATDRLFLVFCRTGDARALGVVFDRTAPELLRIALYLCGDRTDAEDLVQRTFLAAIESRTTYDRRRRALPWLLGILGNHARRLLRERARRRAAAPAAPPAGDDPQAAAANRELAAHLARLRAELGPPYAEVLELHLEQGLNAKEIAQRLGRPAGTVRTQLMRALALLRRHLPAGFVAGLLPPLPGALALAVLKHGVLLAAGHGAGAATATATFATGGLLMSKKLLSAVAAGLLLLAAGVYAAWPNGTAAPADREHLATASGTAPQQPLPATASETDAAAVAPVRDAIVQTADDDPGFGALRVVVRWPDGRPAPAVGVGAAGLDEARNERRLAVTGVDGSCLLPHLRPARWQVALSHAGDVATVTVQPGAPQLCELTAQRAATARGRVVDELERPVHGAEIWIATAGGEPWRQFTLASSDQEGRFELLLAVPVQLGARKQGYAGSLAIAVDPGGPSLDDLVLALRGPGNRVEGTVRDAQGRAVPWARVLVGSPWSVPRSLNGPHEPQRFAPAGRETFTDGDGQYAVDGVEPGREGVQAWAAGHAPAHAVIEIRTAVTVCDLTLQAGASVHGQVRDAAGQPVREASVGPVFADGGFVVASSQTDAEGRYRLVDLYPGQQDLAASAATGRATTIVELTAGATAEWNPVLQRVTGIRGRVLGPDDRPLGGITVSLGDDGGLPVGDRTTTDGSGAFALQPADEGPVCVRVGDWLQPPLKIARWIQPGTQDLVIRLAAADLPTARLRGRIVDANGAPLVATFTANRDRETAAHVAEAAADGRFELGPLPAGRYRGRVVTKAHGSLPVADVLLEPDGQRDLGDLVLQLPGSAVVDVRDEQGQPARSLVRLYTPDGDWVASMQTEQGRAVFAALQPGRYFVCCGGVPRAAHGEFEVLSAARAQADLQLAPVGCADVTVRDPSAVPDLDLAVAAFADGRFAGLFGNMRSGPRVRLWVPPGRYAVEVRAHDGRRARAEVTIRAVDDHPTVAVDLPPK